MLTEIHINPIFLSTAQPSDLFNINRFTWNREKLTSNFSTYLITQIFTGETKDKRL